MTLLIDSLLSPTAPFPRWNGRIKLAGALVPLILITTVVTSEMFAKGFSFAVGAGFFGRTLLEKPLDWLNKNYPNWTDYLALEKYVPITCY